MTTPTATKFSLRVLKAQIATHPLSWPQAELSALVEIAEAARRLDRSHDGDERVLAWQDLADKLRPVIDWPEENAS